MTLEELEIVVKANVQDATKKLESLKSEMGDTGANFQDISKEADNMSMKVSKSGVSFKNFGEVAKGAGKTLTKLAPVIVAVTGGILVLKKTADALKKVFDTTFKVLRGVGKSVLTGTIKLLQGIGSVARNVTNVMSNLTSKGLKNLVQASSSLNNAMSEMYGKTLQLGNALASVVAPIIKAIEPMISSLLNTMIGLANYMAQITASLFGNTTTFKKATKVTTDYAQAVGKANGQLAKFDELNVISDQKNGGTETTPEEMFEEEKISANVLDYTQKIKDKLEEVKKLLNKGEFRGAGDIFGKFFNDEISNIPAYDIAQKIANKINEAMQFINGFLSNNPLGTVGQKLGEFIKGMIDTIDPEEVGEFIANVINNAVGFVSGFLSTNPFDNLGSKLAKTLVTMTKKIDSKEIGRTIANVIMTGVDLVLDFLTQMNEEDGWIKIGEWITNGLNEMVNNLNPEDIGEAISGFVTGILDLGITFFETADWVMIGRKIYETITSINWGEIIIKLVRFILSVWKSLLATIFGILSGIASDIVNWIKTDVKDAVVNAVKFVIGFIFIKINEAKTNLLNTLTTAWKAITTWWEDKKRIFKQGGIQAIFKSIFNDIIGIVEKAVNHIIKKINTLQWEVPDWVPGIGGSVWGFNFNTITIPRLAEGGVLTKPTPVLAGEYAGASTNPEIVAPQSLMYETNMKANVPVINAIEEMSDNIVDAFKTIGVYADFGYDRLRVGLNYENYRAGEKLYGI